MPMDRTSARKNLDKRLARLRPADELLRPHKGWVRAMRDAIGMTAAQLATRMKVAQPRITELEKAEVTGRITLTSLERAAEAMGCTLVYALVPRRPLEELVQDRARQVADKILARVDHTMRLEDQGVNADAGELEDARARLAATLVQEKIHSLWTRP
jgi:predicted DNA-binding mobile mystery protein A